MIRENLAESTESECDKTKKTGDVAKKKVWGGGGHPLHPVKVTSLNNALLK